MAFCLALRSSGNLLICCTFGRMYVRIRKGVDSILNSLFWNGLKVVILLTSPMSFCIRIQQGIRKKPPVQSLI